MGFRFEELQSAFWQGLGRQPVVLLAEDDEDINRALCLLLDYAGFEVRSVGTGTALMEELASSGVLEPVQEAPDLIMTDVRLPGFNGLNVVEALRESGWTTPIIVISAFGDGYVRDRVQSMGRTAFFDKPLNPDWLLETAALFVLGRDC